jgi:hypothetical protein
MWARGGLLRAWELTLLNYALARGLPSCLRPKTRPVRSWAFDFCNKSPSPTQPWEKQKQTNHNDRDQFSFFSNSSGFLEGKKSNVKIRFLLSVYFTYVTRG